MGLNITQLKLDTTKRILQAFVTTLGRKYQQSKVSCLISKPRPCPYAKSKTFITSTNSTIRTAECADARIRACTQRAAIVASSRSASDK
jgi:hypothetical protein